MDFYKLLLEDRNLKSRPESAVHVSNCNGLSHGQPQLLVVNDVLALDSSPIYTQTVLFESVLDSGVMMYCIVYI